MQYSLAYQLGERSGGLDPDAKAYIAAVETAGATVTSGQKKAINTFVKSGKSDGWYSSIKRLYLPIWAAAAPNAVDMISLLSGTFNGTVTHSAGYVQGDGSTGRFVSDTSGDAVGMTDSTGGIGALCLLAPSGVGFAAMGGISGATSAIQLYYDGNQVAGTVAGNPPVVVFNGTRANNTGIWMVSRTSVTSLSLHRRTSSGFTTPNTSAVSVAGNTVSTSNMTFMSQAASIYSDARFGVFSMHLGMTSQQATDFTLALKNLWETSTGLTLEGAEYISTIRAAGATVTATQEAAIHDFIRTGKSDGWWSSLKRLYLPIWASAAPNAVDMVTRASGTYNGTVTHSAGYVQGNGSTGYFDSGVQPSSIITAESGTIGSLNYTGHASVNQSAVGCGTTGGTSIRCGSGSSGVIPLATWLGVNVTRSAIGTDGICMASRVSGSTIHTKRNTAGISEDSTTGTLTSSLAAQNIVFLASNAFAGFTSHPIGSYFVASGLDTGEREDFSLALKNLWETSTGLTLP
jgi:hypothetical protein